MNTYTLKNNILELTCLDYGGTIFSLKFKGKEMVKNYANLNDYIHDSCFTCKSIGRYANRIGNSSFVLNGKTYELKPNEGINQLHGGPDSFDERVWDVKTDEDRITMSIFSPDGDNGFPGNLTMTVSFSLKANALHVDFEGECDEDTPFAPTVHPYFLTESPKLQINAFKHVEVGDGLIPTGNIIACDGKYDFSTMKELGNDLDDAFVIENDYALTLESGDTTMEVWTDFPAVQVYSGREGAVAIEPEFYPDSPNHKNFPDTILHPGEKFHKFCEYKFF